ncbi:MAG: protein translocase subunit SecD [Deltaproteobacteria bacterium]|nr:protein translocase subunit SecD [Deltaproteobacteria bacterium]
MKWKAWSIYIATGLSAYLLLPTLLRLEERRAAYASAGQAAPWYFHLLPRKALTLGLDLQGGIYVELQVELDDAIRRKTDLLGNRLTRDLQEKTVTPKAIAQTQLGQLQATLAGPAEADTLRQVLRDYYQGVFLPGPMQTQDAGVTVALPLTQDYRARLVEQVTQQAVESVRNRIDRYGVGEPDIRLQGKDRIAIELPGLQDPDRALGIIKRTGQLEFRLVDTSIPAADLEQRIAEARDQHHLPEDFQLTTVQQLNDILRPKLPEQTELVFEIVRDRVTHKTVRGIPALVSAKAEVTGDLLEHAAVDSQNNEPIVLFTFDKTGAKLFGDLTKANVGKQLAILLDGTLMSAPVIKEPILNGSGQITLGAADYTTMLTEAQDLVLVLQEGALPATLTEATKTVVGPSLGADLIRQGMYAMLAASAVVFLFMMIYYKLSGVLADVAVALNILMVLGALALFGATLTLPGIAGIVLTIGMAVDANVVINERIREELRTGKSVKAAIQAGYDNANRAIIDANVTTLISGIVLYQFGTGPIRGFAVTLCIGILTTLFTAVIFTREVYDSCTARWNLKRLSI